MVITEALKESDLVRRKAWPWWKCLNNDIKDVKRIWLITDTPRQNRWIDSLPYEDAVAEDWEPLERVP